jgi:hypothetical protein
MENKMNGINSASVSEEVPSNTLQSNLAESLMSKRQTLLKQLNELDSKTALIQEEYLKKIQELQKQKKSIEEALFHVEALLKIDGYNIDERQQIAGVDKPTNTSANVSINDLVCNLLTEVNKPIHFRDITNRLLAKNIQIPGKDPAATLLTRISRDDRFKRTRIRGVYALSDWRLPKEKTTSVRRKRK